MQQAELALDAAALAARTILESSGEIYRAEETAVRMCAGLGLQQADILCFPTGFMLNAVLPGGQTISRVQRVRERSIQLRTLDEVNSVSRAVAAGLLDAQQALDTLHALRSAPGSRRITLIGAYALASGFFCLMFAGGVKEFLICLPCGALIQALLPLLSRHRVPAMLCSLTGGLLAAGSALVMIRFFGGNQEAIISGTIMPLLPGLAMTNAIRDTLRGDLIAGLARGTEALLSAVMLAAGVAFVLMV